MRTPLTRFNHCKATNHAGQAGGFRNSVRDWLRSVAAIGFVPSPRLASFRRRDWLRSVAGPIGFVRSRGQLASFGRGADWLRSVAGPIGFVRSPRLASFGRRDWLRSVARPIGFVRSPRLASFGRGGSVRGWLWGTRVSRNGDLNKLRIRSRTTSRFRPDRVFLVGWVWTQLFSASSVFSDLSDESWVQTQPTFRRRKREVIPGLFLSSLVGWPSITQFILSLCRPADDVMEEGH